MAQGNRMKFSVFVGSSPLSMKRATTMNSCPGFWGQRRISEMNADNSGCDVSGVIFWVARRLLRKTASARLRCCTKCRILSVVRRVTLCRQTNCGRLDHCQKSPVTPLLHYVGASNIRETTGKKTLFMENARQLNRNYSPVLVPGFWGGVCARYSHN